MKETEEIAKAIQATAKLGTRGFDIAEKAGGFLAKVFKEPIDEITGMITDKLRFIRWKRMVEMSEEVNKILEQRKITETRSVPPKLALPIIEEASLEEDDELKRLWNNLLANAMDPGFNSEVRYGYIDMIKNITGKESFILQNLYNLVEKAGHIDDYAKLAEIRVNKEEIINLLGSNYNDYAISANNLMRMQLVAPAVITGGISTRGHKLSAYKGIDIITLTPLGVKFVEACIK